MLSLSRGPCARDEGNARAKSRIACARPHRQAVHKGSVGLDCAVGHASRPAPCAAGGPSGPRASAAASAASAAGAAVAAASAARQGRRWRLSAAAESGGGSEGRHHVMAMR